SSVAAAGPADARRVSLPVLSVVAEATAETAAATSVVRDARRSWRSIAEKEGSPALATAAAREFPPGASELTDVNRRSFMQLLGSGAALAGVAACSQPQESAVPFVRRPEEVTPGNALHFATAYALDGHATGLIVESHEGRPTKIEGNPEHHDS